LVVISAIVTLLEMTGGMICWIEASTAKAISLCKSMPWLRYYPSDSLSIVMKGCRYRTGSIKGWFFRVFKKSVHCNLSFSMFRFLKSI
jgi:hypothetical protein